MTRLDASCGSIVVRTFRAGPAARLGHDLVLAVGQWHAELEVAAGSLVLEVDPRSLSVREGYGGLKALGRPERAQIARTIDRRVLRGHPIVFRADAVERQAAGLLLVTGALTLNGQTRPLRAYVDDHGHGALGAVVRLRQSDWGISPYQAAFGAQRVRDEVEVELAVRTAVAPATR